MKIASFPSSAARAVIAPLRTFRGMAATIARAAEPMTKSIGALVDATDQALGIALELAEGRTFHSEEERAMLVHRMREARAALPTTRASLNRIVEVIVAETQKVDEAAAAAEKELRH